MPGPFATILVAMTSGADDLADAIAADWRWMQRVAQGLLRDPFLADNACQEAWRAAQQRERGWRPPRAWLREALGRIARGLRRGVGRHERLLARLPVPDAQPTTAELVARSETCRRLAGWLHALHEPLRTTALLRFQHDCPVAEIAIRQACPPDTIRWRLRRATDVLRARCESELRKDWRETLGALAPLSLSGPRTAAALPLTAPALPVLLLGGSLLVKAKMILGAAAVAVLTTCWLTVAPSRSELAGSARVPTAAATTAVSEVANAPPADLTNSVATQRALAIAVPPADGDIRGTVTLVAENGREHVAESGNAQIAVTCVGKYTVHRVTIEAGRWRLDLPDWPEKLELLSAVLGGRRTGPAEPVVAPAHAEPFGLRVRSLPELTLRVVADDTGADLGDVTALAEESGFHDRHPAGRNQLAVATAARSPLRFQATKAGETQWFFVGAPGYAWNTVEISLSDPSERVVRLVRGGSVEVPLHGKLPAGAVLRVRPEGGRECRLEIESIRARRFPIGGLPCGSWLVALEVGVWVDQAEVIAQATVEVVAGATVSATLHIPNGAARPPSTVHVTGKLYVPSGWRDVRELVLEGAGKTKARFPGWRRLKIADMFGFSPRAIQSAITAANFAARCSCRLRPSTAPSAARSTW